MSAHHKSHRSSGENAAVSSRHQPCRKPSSMLHPARYVPLDAAHEEAALAALAELLATYTDPDDVEAA
jgi:folylpolyglutamate synthase/dihydropteroate synthase